MRQISRTRVMELPIRPMVGGKKSEVATSARGFTAKTGPPSNWWGIDETHHDMKTQLQRYDRAFHTISQSGVTLKKGVGLDTVNDFACLYALQVNGFEEKSTQVGTIVLVAALLITMVLPTALSPQPFPRCNPNMADDESLAGCVTDSLYSTYIVMVLISVAAFTLSILFSISLIQALTRPYTEMDTLVVWMRLGRLMQAATNASLTVGIVTTYAQVLFAIFLSYPEDNQAIPYCGVAIFIFTTLIYLVINAKENLLSNESQHVRSLAFAKAFCDEQGQLTPYFMSLAWGEQSGADLAEHQPTTTTERA